MDTLQIEEANSGLERGSTFRLSENEQEDYEHLSELLPYFSEFMNCGAEKSVTTKKNVNLNDPLSYLQALDDKYDINHPKIFDLRQRKDYHLRPWIEGKIEELDGKTIFGAKWETKLFRLFDEALIWFDPNDDLFDLIGDDDEKFIKPLGVLPLAMITGLKTCDVDKMDGNISEDELMKLELKMDNKTVLTMKCSDFNQRIKWYECLHTAIYLVRRPEFAKNENIWTVIKTENEKEHINKPNYIQMGKELVAVVIDNEQISNEMKKSTQAKSCCIIM
eukprot:315957_1